MGPNHQVSDHKLPALRVWFVSLGRCPMPSEAFSFGAGPHLKTGFDQGRRCRQRQGFPGLKRTIREFEARIALMPRSGIGAGIGPGPPSFFKGTGKRRVGFVSTELSAQHRRRGLNSVVVQVGPWRGPTEPFFPLTRPVIAWDMQAAPAFIRQRIVRSDDVGSRSPCPLKVIAIPAFRCLRGGIRQYCEVTENHSRGRPQRCVQKLSDPKGMTVYPLSLSPLPDPSLPKSLYGRFQCAGGTGGIKLSSLGI